MASSLRGHRSRKLKADINVVPYIDVMLVLLVIFMVAAPITNPGVINLPSAEKSSLPPSEYIQISLKPNPAETTIGVVGQKTGQIKPELAGTPDRVLQKLKALHESDPELAIMISGDKDIRYNEVVKMISEAKKIGFKRVGLATKS